MSKVAKQYDFTMSVLSQFYNSVNIAINECSCKNYPQLIILLTMTVIGQYKYNHLRLRLRHCRISFRQINSLAEFFPQKIQTKLYNRA